MQRKSTKPWIILIIAPFAALILTAIMQLIVRFTLSATGEGTETIVTVVVNIIALLVGVLAVIGLFGLPVWITMLVIAINHNNKLDSQNRNRK